MFHGTLTGNLGRDPEFQTTQSGQMVAKFSLAVRQPKRQNQDPPPFWVKVETWGKTAEYAANYLKKGNSVCVTGQVAEESWTDQATGQLRKAVVIKNASLESWQQRSEQAQPPVAAPAPAPMAAPAPVTQPQAWQSSAPMPDDEIPF